MPERQLCVAAEGKYCWHMPCCKPPDISKLYNTGITGILSLQFRPPFSTLWSCNLIVSHQYFSSLPQEPSSNLTAIVDASEVTPIVKALEERYELLPDGYNIKFVFATFFLSTHQLFLCEFCVRNKVPNWTELECLRTTCFNLCS